MKQTIDCVIVCAVVFHHKVLATVDVLSNKVEYKCTLFINEITVTICLHINAYNVYCRNSLKSYLAIICAIMYVKIHPLVNPSLFKNCFKISCYSLYNALI